MAKYLDIIKEVYYDVKNPASFSGVNKLYNEVVKRDPSITKNFVESWLGQQDTYTLFRKVKRKFPRLAILVDKIDEQWQADLMDMSWFHMENDGIKYLLTVVDVLSRYAWVVPLRNKSSETLLSAFKLLFQIRKPQKLQTDQGKEFKNYQLQKFLDQNNVKYFTTTDDTTKCAIVERFNRTLRSKIYKYVYNKNEYRYIDALGDMMLSYNHSKHRTIGMSPIEVNQENTLQVIRNIKKSRHEERISSKSHKIGQFVRIARKKPIFEKGSTANFSYEVFRITERKLTDRGFIYKLEDLAGESITSIFYQDELLPVEKPSIYKIEKVLKTRKNTKTKKLEYFVKWLGYPDKFNSWVENIE